MIDAQDIYVADSCLNRMEHAGHYTRIGKAKVAGLIATGREVTPTEAATVGVRLGKGDRGFIFKEYAGITVVKAQSGPGKHPWIAIAYHLIPEDCRDDARERFPHPFQSQPAFYVPVLPDMFSAPALDARKPNRDGRISGTVRWVHAVPGGVYEAVLEVKPGESPIFRLTHTPDTGPRRTVYAHVDLHPTAAPETILSAAQTPVAAKWAGKAAA